MREAFAVVLFAVAGAVGCGSASTSIEAEQHGKRLNLVNGTDVVSDPVSASRSFRQSRPGAGSEPRFRDVAGVVLTDKHYGAQQLTQWLLDESGADVVTRICPVKPAGGVTFDDCQAWSAPQSVTTLGLGEPIRSLSSYLFSQNDRPVLAQVVFNMTGSERRERTCPLNGAAIAWDACSDWIALEESATALGVPQEDAFDDEVVVPYVDASGAQAFTQQLLAPSGDAVWSRSCSITAGQVPGVGGSCAFAPAERISAIGIHFDAVNGVGGYTYSDGGELIYAQTVLASDGTSASRRLCPVTSTGVAFEKCLGWQTIDVKNLARPASPL